MSEPTSTQKSPRLSWMSSSDTSGANPRHRSESSFNSTGGSSKGLRRSGHVPLVKADGGAIEERFLRNASMIDQEAVNRQSLFPSHEAYREGCTARATIYCASIAAAILCARYKRWAMRHFPDR